MSGEFSNWRFKSAGTIPTRGLLICNHVSYVDILVLVSLAPAVFVAKREVKSWPVMGLLAQLGGTVFIDRQRRTHVGEVNDEIQTALADGALVIVFPEGTSSDGRPFCRSSRPCSNRPRSRNIRSPLAALNTRWLTAMRARKFAIGATRCFFPHLLNLLSKRSVRATVRFAPVESHSTDRKELAQQLHAAVLGFELSAAANGKC